MTPRPMLDPAYYPAGTTAEPSGPAVAWAAVFAGTVTAIAATILLGLLGAGLGLSSTSAWPGMGARPAAFTIGAGIWLVVMQWLSSILGGYVAGRLRTRWHSLHDHEVFFRDTAHGLLTWATATVVVAGVAALATALMPVDIPADVQMSTQAIEAARKSAEAFAIFTAIAMLLGAFVASVAGVVGGRLRDKHP